MLGSRYTVGMYGELSVEELKEKLDRETLNNAGPREGFALLAVVCADEFAAAHIPGARHVAPADIGSWCTAHYESVKQIVICGKSRDHAQEVCTNLRQAGFRDVLPLRGDVRLWQETGYDVITRVDGLSGKAGNAPPIEEGECIDEGDRID